jgi:hypothetical protein
MTRTRARNSRMSVEIAVRFSRLLPPPRRSLEYSINHDPCRRQRACERLRRPRPGAVCGAGQLGTSLPRDVRGARVLRRDGNTTMVEVDHVEGRIMKCEHRCWLNDVDRRAPAAPLVRQPYPQHTINSRQTNAWTAGTIRNRQLVRGSPGAATCANEPKTATTGAAKRRHAR